MDNNEKKLLEKVKSLVEEIQKNEDEVKQVENKVNVLEMQRLNKVIEIAKKGIKFEKNIKKRVYYNNWNNYRSDEIEYFYSEDGKPLKGVVVATLELSKNRTVFGGSEEKKELFLLEDGTFKVFYYHEDYSNFQDAESYYQRKIAKNQDISKFDTDEIIESIIWQLKKRLEALGERKQTQMKRIEKLESLKIYQKN